MIKIVHIETTDDLLSCPFVFCNICNQKIVEGETPFPGGKISGGEYIWFPDDNNPMGWKADEVHFVHHHCAGDDERLRNASWHMIKNFYKYLGVNLGIVKAKS